MIIVEGDLWKEVDSGKYDAVLIPTNGFVSYKSGENIMGAGVAKKAKQRYPGIEKKLGTLLKVNASRARDPHRKEPWNIPYLIGRDDNGTRIISFPTKPTWVYSEGYNQHVMEKFRAEVSLKGKMPGFASKSDLILIERSATEIAKIADSQNFTRIALPTVGTGQGELEVDDVLPILERHFDDRFCVVVK